MIILNNSLRSIGFFLFCVVLAFINNIIFSWIEFYYFPGIPSNPVEKESLAFKVIVWIVFIPLVETYIFQVLPNIIMNKLKIKNLVIRIVLSSIMFALGHNFNLFYMCMAFFMGLIYMYMYLNYKENGNRRAFMAVVILHALYNCATLFI